MFKENWTNIPGTFRQIKRFFIGSKDQQAPPEKVELSGRSPPGLRHEHRVQLNVIRSLPHRMRQALFCRGRSSAVAFGNER